MPGSVSAEGDERVRSCQIRLYPQPKPGAVRHVNPLIKASSLQPWQMISCSSIYKLCTLPLSAQALKQVKGVLNKLTPEKFEQLLQQLLDAVKSVIVLRGLITLIFENAVAQVRPP